MKKGVLYMLGSTLAFACMQICVKFLPHLPAHELILFRSLVSIVLSVAILKKLGIQLLGNNKKVLLMRGVFGTTALLMFFYTLQNIPLASAVTLQYLSPIFTALFAAIFLKEKMQMKQWLYFGVSFAGVALIKGFDERISLTFMLLGICSAMFSGMAYTCIRRLKDSEHPLVVVLYFPLVAIPIMSVLSYYKWVTPQGTDWLYLLLMGLFTQVAQLLMTKGIQSGIANKMISLKYIGTIYALAIGYLIFGESYGLMSLIGIAMVIAGVVLNLWKKRVK
ncbi:MAG: DMT family transporter [Flavobacteriales bacterium]|nr:DMT family transporter [Flavobacteriales bacterium]